jgi:hypothetical protein
VAYEIGGLQKFRVAEQVPDSKMGEGFCIQRTLLDDDWRDMIDQPSTIAG